MSFDAENLLLAAAVYGGVVLAVFWLALIIWTYRDMRARSRDPLAQILVAVVVAVLNIPGVFVYIMLRPRETLSESYERSLEEEALLQEIEEKPNCPGCGQRVQTDWQACPYCHTRLKKPCMVCGHMLELSWDLCPHCAAPQRQYMPEDDVVNTSRHVQRQPPHKPPAIPDKWLASPRNNPRSTSSPNAYPQQSPPADAPQYVDDTYGDY